MNIKGKSRLKAAIKATDLGGKFPVNLRRGVMLLFVWWEFAWPHTVR